MLPVQSTRKQISTFSAFIISASMLEIRDFCASSGALSARSNRMLFTILLTVIILLAASLNRVVFNFSKASLLSSSGEESITIVFISLLGIFPALRTLTTLDLTIILVAKSLNLLPGLSGLRNSSTVRELSDSSIVPFSISFSSSLVNSSTLSTSLSDIIEFIELMSSSPPIILWMVFIKSSSSFSEFFESFLASSGGFDSSGFTLSSTLSPSSSFKFSSSFFGSSGGISSSGLSASSVFDSAGGLSSSGLGFSSSLSASPIFEFTSSVFGSSDDFSSGLLSSALTRSLFGVVPLGFSLVSFNLESDFVAVAVLILVLS